MKNLKPAWKLFSAILKQNKLIWLWAVLTILGISMLIIVGVTGEAIGHEDHLLSASFTTFGYYLTYFGFFFVFTNFINNRFFISCPEAKRIFTHIIPLSSVIISIILFLISIVTAALSGYTAQMMSDILLFNALGNISALSASAFTITNMSYIHIYVCFLPYLFIMFTHEKTTEGLLFNLHHNGFGVPVEISAIIYVVTFIAGVVLSLRLSEVNYKKRNTKLMNAVAQNPLLNK